MPGSRPLAARQRLARHRHVKGLGLADRMASREIHHLCDGRRASPSPIVEALAWHRITPM